MLIAAASDSPPPPLSALLLLGALAASSVSLIAADQMPFPALATNLVPRESKTDFSVVLEWPPGAEREPARTQWFGAWLRCSTLTVYCTPSEVRVSHAPSRAVSQRLTRAPR